MKGKKENMEKMDFFQEEIMEEENLNEKLRKKMNVLDEGYPEDNEKRSSVERTLIVKKVGSERGVRLRVLRQFCNMTLNEFADTVEMNLATVGRIERGYSCLTPNQAGWVQICILRKLGVRVHKDWLLYGKKEGPSKLVDKKVDLKNILEISQISDGISTFLEIEAFSQFNKNAHVIMVRDNRMNPIYSKGDYVGGLALTNDFYHLAHNKDCIVEIDRGHKIVRRVYVKDNTFVLLGMDYQSPEVTTTDPILLAPIVMVRKNSVEMQNILKVISTNETIEEISSENDISNELKSA